MVEVKCCKCGIIFKVYKYRLKKTKNFYCKDCYKTERKKILASYIHVGQKAAQKKMFENGLTDKQKEGLVKGRYKGKTHSEETKRKIALAHKGIKSTKSQLEGLSIRWLPEEKSPHWKGDNVGYRALHDWVRRHRGRPLICEFCKKKYPSQYMNWANKSGEYKRDLSDWLRLCVPCHKKYDAKTQVSD